MPMVTLQVIGNAFGKPTNLEHDLRQVLATGRPRFIHLAIKIVIRAVHPHRERMAPPSGVNECAKTLLRREKLPQPSDELGDMLEGCSLAWALSGAFQRTMVI
jgi:hypothetical protein